MAYPKGQRIGGRQKGTPNKRTEEIADKLRRLDCDPVAGMALIASGKVPCGVCHGEGKTRYRIPGTDKVGQRLCESCYGTLMEHISPSLRAQMYAELANYILPKRKAVELTGADGAPLDNRMEVVFVEAEEGRRK